MVRGAVSDIVSGRDLNEEIAKVAYELYKDRGMGDGYDFDDWLRAEKIVIDRHSRMGKEDEALATSLINKRLSTKKRNKKMN